MSLVHGTHKLFIMHIKRYLITAGANYYPGHGTSDWQKSLDDLDDAMQYATKLSDEKNNHDWVIVIDLSDFREVLSL